MTITVACDTSAARAHIQLNRPRLGNMLDHQMLTALTQALEQLDSRVLLLSGAGESFCNGADIMEMRRLDPTGLRRVLRAGRRAYQALLDTDAVTIAVLHGNVTGAGLALAAACDLRIAAPQTRFLLPELDHGVTFSWGGALPRIIAELGAPALRRLALLAEPFTAEHARGIGLVHEITDTPAILADAWATRCARHHPDALTLAKRQLRGNTSSCGDPREFDEDLLIASINSARQAETGPFVLPRRVREQAGTRRESDVRPAPTVTAQHR
ncbi:enoyl-CoA hydratase/isomerase family protein [Streptomyces sp. DK15]|uniref:enoyl-CoA hydratase/isomerase family protein n=1 Tax=Streptomyces sp. DK15 TaxID=2957499 RepID=UPI0029A1B623|nr:enoyl-CoA hydratase/isomerase family protein [Streptomyces sp. DK15]MDX2393603.1 enoyl-CoA hydratase/isomerase family protein [Streptomyces sp. DK15]